MPSIDTLTYVLLVLACLGLIPYAMRGIGVVILHILGLVIMTFAVLGFLVAALFFKNGARDYWESFKDGLIQGLDIFFTSMKQNEK